MQDDTTELLTFAETMQLLKIKERALRRWVAEEGLPVARLGNRLRFDRAEVLAWVKAHARTSGKGGDQA